MAVKRVFSAGGIVIRKSTKSMKSTGGTEDGEIEVLVTQHSKHKGWDFPKGHVESGEAVEAAALREVQEETGVIAEILEKVGRSEYFYYENGEKMFKTVIYFLMKYVREGEATTAEEVSAIVWLDPKDVEGKLTFKGSKEVWKAAEKLIVNGK